MTDVYSITGVGLAEARQQLDAIATNVASARVPGYRRHVATTASFATQLSTSDPAEASPGAPRLRPATVSADLKPGAPMVTGRALDISLDDPSHYLGLTDGTTTWLTRAGALRIDAQGVLVGERGLRVVGAAGDIAVSGDDLSVQPDGQILQGGAPVAALQLFRVEGGLSPAADGGTLLSAASALEPADPTTVRVRSGQLESSNVDGAAEAVGLVALSRRYESLIRLTQNYDELLGRTIQKLGEV